jgi:hypothetical protein
MAIKNWLRQTNESAKAYEAARTYFEMGANRTVEAVAAKYQKSIALLNRWSQRYDWVARAKAYDEHQNELQEKAREEAARKEAAKWAKRREELRNEEWKLAERIHTKLAQMLEFPVYQVEYTNEHGVQMTIKPMNWSVRDVTRMAETVAKLYRTSAGMPVETTRQEITGADGGAIEITNAASEFERRLAALFERATAEEVSGQSDDSGQGEA